ncbi:kinase-like domain-containing protein [Crucibulum laeve]|uniref:Kinase-like domain-containing protein n=1 Tax=Crucibulum laeve TaxID=68775 RepID=A0A5C3M198_9AGAR|nr:kinase-like domain-containing protein [Crucibulum laeve]
MDPIFLAPHPADSAVVLLMSLSNSSATHLDRAQSNENLRHELLTEELEAIGQHCFAIGEYSDVWKEKLPDGEIVAVKVLRGASTNNTEFLTQLDRDLLRNGKIWKELKHDNVIKFYGLSYNHGIMPALVFPFFANGSVLQYMKRRKLSDWKKFQWVDQIAQALHYLHSRDIIHGDLRGANVLLDDKSNAVVMDYQLSFILEASEFTSIKTAGTCRWAAPEIMNPSNSDSLSEPRPNFSKAGDVFAFAMTIIEIYTESPPFSVKKNDSAVIFAILAGKRPEIPANVAKNKILAEVVTNCWSQLPENRPSAESVCKTLADVPLPSFLRRFLDGIFEYLSF